MKELTDKISHTKIPKLNNLLKQYIKISRRYGYKDELLGQKLEY